MKNIILLLVALMLFFVVFTGCAEKDLSGTIYLKKPGSMGGTQPLAGNVIMAIDVTPEQFRKDLYTKRNQLILESWRGAAGEELNRTMEELKQMEYDYQQGLIDSVNIGRQIEETTIQLEQAFTQQIARKAALADTLSKIEEKSRQLNMALTDKVAAKFAALKAQYQEDHLEISIEGRTSSRNNDNMVVNIENRGSLSVKSIRLDLLYKSNAISEYARSVLRMRLMGRYHKFPFQVPYKLGEVMTIGNIEILNKNRSEYPVMMEGLVNGEVCRIEVNYGSYYDEGPKPRVDYKKVQAENGFGPEFPKDGFTAVITDITLGLGERVSSKHRDWIYYKAISKAPGPESLFPELGTYRNSCPEAAALSTLKKRVSKYKERIDVLDQELLESEQSQKVFALNAILENMATINAGVEYGEYLENQLEVLSGWSLENPDRYKDWSVALQQLPAEVGQRVFGEFTQYLNVYIKERTVDMVRSSVAGEYRFLSLPPKAKVLVADYESEGPEASWVVGVDQAKNEMLDLADFNAVPYSLAWAFMSGKH